MNKSDEPTLFVRANVRKQPFTSGYTILGRHETLEDERCSGRPSPSKNEGMIEQAEQLIRSGRRMSII
ncbi:hypothetical protein CEXT_257751 [Caerostris extrusa]|uniref:Uncharacterized protein n=1 Tax=Caerostris extrusa TaxID=172846 RepID=A0AAV4WJ87_CAEEX|nr:hypothetical protein CEXT_257751 [Caerostris extrusa]